MLDNNHSVVKNSWLFSGIAALWGYSAYHTFLFSHNFRIVSLLGMESFLV